MFAKFIILFAAAAAANAGLILPATETISNIAVAKTSIVGPSGNITKEESLPVIAHHQPAFVHTPLVRYHHVPFVVGANPVVHHEVVHPVEESVEIKPVAVAPHYPLVHPVGHHPLLLKTIPATLPYASPYYNFFYNNVAHNGLYYI